MPVHQQKTPRFSPKQPFFLLQSSRPASAVWNLIDDRGLLLRRLFTEEGTKRTPSRGWGGGGWSWGGVGGGVGLGGGGGGLVGGCSGGGGGVLWVLSPPRFSRHKALFSLFFLF